MGATAFAVIAGVAVSKSMAPKIRIPKPEAPPEPEKAKAKAATQARDSQTRRARAASGRSSTILTGPDGLGAAPTETRKTLLGQ